MGRRRRRRQQQPQPPPPARSPRLSGAKAGALALFLLGFFETVGPTLCTPRERDMRVASDAGEPAPLPPVPQVLWTDMHTDASGIPLGIGRQLPLRPFQGQRAPPCPPGAHEINGGCWDGTDVPPPCPPPRHFEWRGRCYLPVALVEKPPVGMPP